MGPRGPCGPGCSGPIDPYVPVLTPAVVAVNDLGPELLQLVVPSPLGPLFGSYCFQPRMSFGVQHRVPERLVFQYSFDGSQRHGVVFHQPFDRECRVLGLHLDSSGFDDGVHQLWFVSV